MIYTDELICHYTSMESMEKILRTGTLKLSPSSQMNDPQESTAWNTSHDRLNKLNRTCYSDKFWFELKESILSEYKMICFCDSDKGIVDLGISHMSSWSHPALWTHYAKNHNGVCLVFNKKQLLSNIDNHFFYSSIDYREPIDIFNAFDEINERGLSVDEFINKYQKKIFFEKVIDWKNESEFRVVVKSRDEYSINFDKDSLHSIILGCNFPYKKYCSDLEAEYKGKYDMEIFGEYYMQGMLAITWDRSTWLKCKDPRCL